MVISDVNHKADASSVILHFHGAWSPFSLVTRREVEEGKRLLSFADISSEFTSCFKGGN